MKLIKFLNSAIQSGQSTEQALVSLEECYGIKNSYNEEYKLWVLNYDQIKSSTHKFEPIVCECRSLVVEHDGELFKVVSRAFDRFFNYGEKPIPHKIGKLRANEKLDGSLVTVFNFKGQWLYRTKSMIMPETSINGFETTWKEVIEEALGEHYKTRLTAFEHLSFILEVCSPENRVVTRYKSRKAVLLSIRNNESGDYERCENTWEYVLNGIPEWKLPRVWFFDNWETCLTTAKELRNLEEGFVMYNHQGEPVCKVKNPAYVAAHHLRGNGVLNPNRVVDLILINEYEEYLALFPEDAKTVQPYVVGNQHLRMATITLYEQFKNLESQKEFALAIKKHPCQGLLFNMRKGFTYEEAFDKLTRNAKQSAIEKFTYTGG